MKALAAGLGKRLASKLGALAARVQESDLFNSLKERFQSLTARRQAALKYASLGLLFLFLAALPGGCFCSSIGHIRDFQAKEALTRSLRELPQTEPSSMFESSFSRLKLAVERWAKKYGGAEIADKGFVKAPLGRARQAEVLVKELNVRQAVQLGQNLSFPSYVRMESIELEESAAAKHYNVRFSLLFFPPSEAGGAPRGAARKRRPPKAESGGKGISGAEGGKSAGGKRSGKDKRDRIIKGR